MAALTLCAVCAALGCSEDPPSAGAEERGDPSEAAEPAFDLDAAPTDMPPTVPDGAPGPADGADPGAEADAFGDVYPDEHCSPVPGAFEPDSYGGDGRVALAATGFFRLEALCGRYWLVTPDGHPFWSAGVNAIGSVGSVGRVSGEAPYAEAVAAEYASVGAWADATAERLREWGFNTAGSWSDAALMGPRMAFTVNLSLSQADWLSGAVPDYFSEPWAAEVARRAQLAAQWREDANLVGYFLDNEVRWGPDWRAQTTLLQDYLALPADAPGKVVAVDVLLGAAGGVSALAEALGADFEDELDVRERTEGWGSLAPAASDLAATATTAFLSAAADRYFSVASAAVRAQDPNHLILGNREVSVTTRLEVYAAAAPWVDVLSINSYEYLPSVEELALRLSGAPSRDRGFEAIHGLVERPILVSEFGFRADDSGLPNSWPPVYPVLDTQADRAAAFAQTVQALQGVPWIVGAHWFEWVDQPAEGRFDGENNNWGLVSIQDEAYTELTGRAAIVLPEVYGRMELPRD